MTDVLSRFHVGRDDRCYLIKSQSNMPANNGEGRFDSNDPIRPRCVSSDTNSENLMASSTAVTVYCGSSTGSEPAYIKAAECRFLDRFNSFSHHFDFFKKL